MKTKTTTKTTKTTATKTAKAPRTYETLTHDALKALALEVASQVHTCKEASARYASLADRFGPAVAKEILAQAKASVRARVQAIADDAKSVSARLRNGEAVARDAWQGVLADKDVQGRKWARIVYESAGCDLLAMAVRFADYVAEMPDGTLAVAKRTTRKDANGEPVSGYAPMRQTVSAWMAVLQTAVKNAKRSALGKPRSDYQRTVTLTWDE